MTMFDADRLQRINAPARAPCVEGGLADQKSSQISRWNTKSGRSGCGEDDIDAERDRLTGERHLDSGYARTWRKPPVFVVLPIVGQEGFGDDAEYPPAGESHATVVEAPIAAHGRAHDDHRRDVP